MAAGTLQFESVRVEGRPSRSRWIVLVAAAAALAAGCASRTPSFEDVAPADELYAEGLETLKPNPFLLNWVDYSEAIDTFQAIIDNYPYSDYAVKAELAIADAYFEDEKYDEALSYYRDFADLHPEHEQVPYTTLRSALCHYNQVRSVDRDQTSTSEALVYLERLISTYPYSPETRQAEVVLHELRTRLSRSVMRKGDFYLGRGEYQSAAERYRSVLDTFPGLGLDAEGLYKLGTCYENMQLQDEALRLFHVVVENFRDTEVAAFAEERIAKAR